MKAQNNNSIQNQDGNISKPLLCEVVLRERFTSADDEAVTFTEQYESYQKIADEYALNFAKWIREETYYEHLTKEFIFKQSAYKNEKELIEIFKRDVFHNLT